MDTPMSDLPDTDSSMDSKQGRTTADRASETDPAIQRTAGEPARSSLTSRRECLSLLAALPAAGTGLAATSGTAVADTDDSEQPAGYGAGGFGAVAYGAGPSSTPPTTCTYATEAGTVETDNLLNAIGDWQNGDISTSQLLDVITAWQSNESVSNCT